MGGIHPLSHTPQGFYDNLHSLQQTLSSFNAGAAAIENSSLSLTKRCDKAVQRCQSDVERVLATLHCTQHTRVAAARTLHQFDEKGLSERVEEAEINAELLDAVAALCVLGCAGMVSMHTDAFAFDFDALLSAFIASCNTINSAVTITACRLSSQLEHWNTVWSDSVDAGVSDVCGPGLLGFVPNEASVNSVVVIPRTHVGCIAEFVTADDVVLTACMGVEQQQVTLPCRVVVDQFGQVHIAYTVVQQLASITLNIYVLDVLVWYGMVPCWCTQGTHTRTLHILDTTGTVRAASAESWTFGLVVSDECRLFTISYYREHVVRIYYQNSKCSDDDRSSDLVLLHSVGDVGRYGAGQLQFNSPFRMCIAPSTGNLLICEDYNDRIQELTSPSALTQPAFVRFLHVRGSRAIAMQAGSHAAEATDIIAVGTHFGTIDVIEYATGVPLRTIDSPRIWRENLNRMCESLCFTTGGRHIVMVDTCSDRTGISIFNTLDGTFVRRVGIGSIGSAHNDIVLAVNGELVLANFNRHQCCVFSPVTAAGHGCALLRSWGSYGAADGEFQHPAALAVHGHQLFVLERCGARVQVFI